MPKTLKTSKRSLLCKLAGNGPISLKIREQIKTKNWKVDQLVDKDVRRDVNTGGMATHYLVLWNVEDYGMESDLTWEPYYNISRDVIDVFEKKRNPLYVPWDLFPGPRNGTRFQNPRSCKVAPPQAAPLQPAPHRAPIDILSNVALVFDLFI